MKSGTIFSFSGDVWGYDLYLFNVFDENEILLEPERKFLVEESIPPVNDIIYIKCKILNTPIVLENIFLNDNIKAKINYLQIKNNNIYNSQKLPGSNNKIIKTNLSEDSLLKKTDTFFDDNEKNNNIISNNNYSLMDQIADLSIEGSIRNGGVHYQTIDDNYFCKIDNSFSYGNEINPNIDPIDNMPNYNQTVNDTFYKVPNLKNNSIYDINHPLYNGKHQIEYLRNICIQPLINFTIINYKSNKKPCIKEKTKKKKVNKNNLKLNKNKNNKFFIDLKHNKSEENLFKDKIRKKPKVSNTKKNKDISPKINLQNKNQNLNSKINKNINNLYPIKIIKKKPKNLILNNLSKTPEKIIRPKKNSNNKIHYKNLNNINKYRFTNDIKNDKNKCFLKYKNKNKSQDKNIKTPIKKKEKKKKRIQKSNS